VNRDISKSDTLCIDLLGVTQTQSSTVMQGSWSIQLD